MASLEISLYEIPADGLDYVSEVTHLDLELGKGDPEFKEAFEFKAKIHAVENEAWVDGDFHGTLIQECVRCLEGFESILDIPVAAYYVGQEVIAAKEQSKNSKEDDEDDGEEVDCFPILNDRMNLADMLREQLILSLPIQPLCSEQCQGLCLVCGQNLNHRQCGCEIQTGKTPFAALRDKLNPSEKLEG